MRYLLIKDHEGDIGLLELEDKVNLTKLVNKASIRVLKEMSREEFEKENKRACERYYLEAKE